MNRESLRLQRASAGDALPDGGVRVDGCPRVAVVLPIARAGSAVSRPMRPLCAQNAAQCRQGRR